RDRLREVARGNLEPFNCVGVCVVHEWIVRQGSCQRGGRRPYPFAMVSRILLTLVGIVLQAQPYDVVIRNGRVMDPETKLDGVRNVGIRGGKIAAISTDALDGKRVIDATNLIVAPGFIDLHWHGREPASDRYEAMDGVT